MDNNAYKENQRKAGGKKLAENATKVAATGFAGPVGGKAVSKFADTKLGSKVFDKAGTALSKAPVLGSALGNKRVNQALNMGNKQSESSPDDKSSENESNNKASNSKSPSYVKSFNDLKKITSKKDSNKQLEENSDENVKSNKPLISNKLKQRIIIGSIGVVGSLLLIVVVITVILSPVIAAAEMVESTKNNVQNFFSSLGNWLSFKGWCANDQECLSNAEQDFYTKLNELLTSYKNDGIELDEKLITGTIFYGKELGNGFNTSVGELDTDDTQDEITRYRNGTSMLATICSKMVVNEIVDLSAYYLYLTSDYIPNNLSELLTGTAGDERTYRIKSIADEIMLYTENWSGSGNYSNSDGLTFPAGTTSFNGTFYYFDQTNYTASNSFRQGATISSSGCGVTALAMVISSLTGNIIDPYTMAKETCAKHSCAQGTATSAMTGMPPLYGLTSVAVSGNKEGKQKVIDALATGNSLVIAHMGSGHFTKGGHYIVLGGVNAGGEVYVYDPNKGEKRGTNKYWGIDLVASELKGNFYIISR